MAALPREERTARPPGRVFRSTCAASSSVEPCRDPIWKQPPMEGSYHGTTLSLDQTRSLRTREASDIAPASVATHRHQDTQRQESSLRAGGICLSAWEAEGACGKETHPWTTDGRKPLKRGGRVYRVCLRRMMTRGCVHLHKDMDFYPSCRLLDHSR